MLLHFLLIFGSPVLAEDYEELEGTRVWFTHYPTAEDPRCVPGCIFNNDTLDNGTIDIFPKHCSTVCAPYGLIVDDTVINGTQLTEILKNMKHLVGKLHVTTSESKSCSFLVNLETIDCYNSGFFWVQGIGAMMEIGMPKLTNVSCHFRVDKTNITRLGLPHMKLVPSPTGHDFDIIDLKLHITSLSFCITMEEMLNLASSEYIRFNLDSYSKTPLKYCEISNTSSVKSCDLRNSTLKNLDSGCVWIRGDVKIGEGDEEYVQKLESVEAIFGRLFITETNLTNIDFFPNLKYIMVLGRDDIAMLVEDNEFLTNFSFPSFQRTNAEWRTPFQFYDNSDVLKEQSSRCYGLQKQLAKNDTSKLTFDGKTCERLEMDSILENHRRKSGGTISKFGLLLIVILSLLISEPI